MTYMGDFVVKKESLNVLEKVIFLSYKSEDRPRAKIIAEALEQYDYSVWWDPKIPGGAVFDEYIQRKLNEAKCVIVLWSNDSVKSQWVKDEANRGNRRGILIPVLIDNVEIPLGFGLIQVVRLIDWKGKLPNQDFDLLLDSIAGILGQSPMTKIEDKKPNISLEFDLHDKDDWIDKGNALLKLGKYQGAITAYDKALEIDPHDKIAWYDKGLALNKLGKYKEAITAYDKALKIDPHDELSWYDKGNALLKLGKYREAITAYNKALEIVPHDKNAWNNKGFALYSLGKYQEAITAYDKASEIDPEFKLALDNKKTALINLSETHRPIKE